MIEIVHRLLNQLFIETFLFTGVVACVALGAWLYEPPVAPPKQCNYSQSWVAPVTERPYGFPGIQEGK